MDYTYLDGIRNAKIAICNLIYNDIDDRDIDKLGDKIENIKTQHFSIPT
jgi:hypothetical protein